MPWITLTYSRAKLYEEVWSEPVTIVAKRYGVSDVALRKTCAKLCVPLPPLGYWSKIRFRKAPPRPPLPRYAGPQELTRQRFIDRDPAAPPPPTPPAVARQREFESRDENRITVPATLHGAHPLVLATLHAVESRRGKTSSSAQSHTPVLSIVASDTAWRRALRLASALLRALETRGFTVSASGKNARTPQILVFGETLSFSIDERNRRVERALTAAEQRLLSHDPHPYVPNRFHSEPTGELVLTIVDADDGWKRRTFADGKRRRLEDVLNATVVAFVETAVEIRSKREERERAEERRRRVETRRAKLVAIREAELKRLGEIEKCADAHH
jgi:hypothetical protein